MLKSCQKLRITEAGLIGLHMKLIKAVSKYFLGKNSSALVKFWLQIYNYADSKYQDQGQRPCTWDAGTERFQRGRGADEEKQRNQIRRQRCREGRGLDRRSPKARSRVCLWRGWGGSGRECWVSSGRGRTLVGMGWRERAWSPGGWAEGPGKTGSHGDGEEGQREAGARRPGGQGLGCRLWRKRKEVRVEPSAQ